MMFKKKRKIRIAFGTIFYPLTMSRYMLEALLRRDDVELWTYGPFSGSWIPWGDGMNLPAKYVFTPNAPLPLGPGVQPIVRYGQMEMLKPWEPDLWLEVNAGLEAQGKPVSGKYAVIGTDPHVLGQIYDRVRPRADYFFGMQSPYLGEGDILLPYAYDPIWHSPSPIPMKDRMYDAALIGLQYASRTKLVNMLRSRGLNVFYELGLAHALRKPVVLVSSNEQDVPFDLKHIRVIYYDMTDPFWGQKLMNKVAENIVSAVESPEEAIFSADQDD